MKRRDETILQKIRSEISVAETMAAGRELPDFLSDEMLKRAVCMTVINIGELVKNLSDECRAMDRTIPWKAIAGFRDIAAHKYQTLKMEDVYQTVTGDFPALFQSIGALLERSEAHRILFSSDVDLPAGVEEQIETAIRAALDAEGVDTPCEVDVLVTDDNGIHQVNRDMRGVDAPTDVLSFPMFELSPGDKPSAEDADPESGLVPLGDMCISLERAQAQGEEFGHGLKRELCYLAVHSVLHLLGYDHLDEGPMKAQMRAREEAVMERLGLGREE